MLKIMLVYVAIIGWSLGRYGSDIQPCIGETSLCLSRPLTRTSWAYKSYILLQTVLLEGAISDYPVYPPTTTTTNPFIHAICDITIVVKKVAS